MPHGFLLRAGFSPVVMDLAVEKFDEDKIGRASFIGISVPMHTALRLGVRVVKRIRELNASCHICCYGLYAALSSDYLLKIGANTCLGGEYEGLLVELVESVEMGASRAHEGGIRKNKTSSLCLSRLDFAVPERSGLLPLEKYARLIQNGICRTVGFVKASRGCLHLCTHCPIPPVYGGRFFVVPQPVVLEDIRRQVHTGATHITFSDPDFLNGPTHSLRVVQAMHEEFPEVTFDFTAKIEHLLKFRHDLHQFAELGCLFIISAVESLNRRVLEILDKGHTGEDVAEALNECRAAGIELRPTWVAFTPWTAWEDYLEMLDFVETHGLIENVDPVQYSVRLLIPPGSPLAEHPETLPHLGPFDEAALCYRWKHPDPRMDQLHKDVSQIVAQVSSLSEDPATTFYRIWKLAYGREPVTSGVPSSDRVSVPRLSESWFC